jgi:hypothetical protein
MPAIHSLPKHTDVQLRAAAGPFASIEPGLRDPELSTLTGEFDPPHIDRMAKAKGEIQRSAMVPIKEYSIDSPEQQDLICPSSPSFEYSQNAASGFLRRQCFCHLDPSSRILSHPVTATLRRECIAANFTQNATQERGILKRGFPCQSSQIWPYLRITFASPSAFSARSLQGRAMPAALRLRYAYPYRQARDRATGQRTSRSATASSNF